MPNATENSRWRFSLKRLLASVLVLSAVLALVSWALKPKTLDRGFFPIGVGYRWVYLPNGSEGANEVVFEVTGTERVGEAECYVVERRIGDQELAFYVSVDAAGVYIHRVGEERYEPPYRQFAFGSKRGDSWKWIGQIGTTPGEYLCENYGAQSVSVPIGDFETFRVEQWSPNNWAGSTSFWLAKDHGVVWLRSKARDKNDPPAVQGESERFDWQLRELTKP